MSTAELQQQLQARNVDFQGLTKFELQDVLWRYIQVEAGMLPSEDFGVTLSPHFYTVLMHTIAVDLQAFVTRFKLTA